MSDAKQRFPDDGVPQHRILVVDDEPDLTMLTRLNLERTGRFEVVEVNRPRRCLAAARSFQPDLILLDLVMPDMEGTEVAEQIRSEPGLAGIPIIFITACSPDQWGSLRDAMRDSQILAKPVPIDELLRAIDREIADRD